MRLRYRASSALRLDPLDSQALNRMIVFRRPSLFDSTTGLHGLMYPEVLIDVSDAGFAFAVEDVPVFHYAIGEQEFRLIQAVAIKFYSG